MPRPLFARREKGRSKCQQAHAGVRAGSRARLDYASNRFLKLVRSRIPKQCQEQFMNIPAKKPIYRLAEKLSADVAGCPEKGEDRLAQRLGGPGARCT